MAIFINTNRKSKLIFLGAFVLMSSGFLFSTSINVHAEEVANNLSQVQTTLENIESDNVLSGYENTGDRLSRGVFGGRLRQAQLYQVLVKKNYQSPYKQAWNVITGHANRNNLNPNWR